MAHQHRHQASKRLPLPRKGTKYVVRSQSYRTTGVPLVVAVRDMLHLARTAQEANHLRKLGLLKINGRVPKDVRAGIPLFSRLEAGEVYELSLLPTGKFTFVPAKGDRPVKIIGKVARSGNMMQVNGHDGSNLLLSASKAKEMETDDTLLLGADRNVAGHVSLKKAKTGFVFSGKYAGREGKVKHVEGKHVTLTLDETDVVLPAKGVLVR